MSATTPVRCSPRVQSAVEAACGELGLRYSACTPAAGHDAQNLALITDSGMIFIPSRGGRSHRVDETSDWQAIERGANVLLHTLLALAALAAARRRLRHADASACPDAWKSRGTVTDVKTVTGPRSVARARIVAARCWAGARGTGRCPPSSPARTSRAPSCASTAHHLGVGSSSRVLVFVVLGVDPGRFRDRPGAPHAAQIHGHTVLEIAWTIAPALILLIIAIPTIQVIFRTQGARRRPRR